MSERPAGVCKSVRKETKRREKRCNTGTRAQDEVRCGVTMLLKNRDVLLHTHLGEVSSEVRRKVKVLGGVAAQVQLCIRQQAQAVLHGGINRHAATGEAAVNERGVSLQSVYKSGSDSVTAGAGQCTATHHWRKPVGVERRGLIPRHGTLQGIFQRREG